ncbi:Lon protease like peroxisomal [Lasiodiplodia theobromae]|uniref:Lon protease like peroxisomal n=1 Tax=Lasiodiplodia theobromae TaxID=45133 RepID=UPI0015C323BC|nr:Lon protease like peroxisomal [Lasiodiplodia theobromae]KAF4539624.1 Lon protease like peroxisomal [Lasiodiplodia theobromae]
MSGIEVAGLVFGVVPIFFEILKSYGWAGKKLDTFKRHHDVVREIQLDFRLEERAFRTECHLLLASVVDDKEELLSVLQHPDDGPWDRDDVKRVNDGLQRLMGDDFAICEEIVVKIRDLLRSTTADLARLDRLSNSGGTNESSSTAIQDLRHAFKVSTKESGYRKTLQSLNLWNAKFRSLRKQKCAVQNPRHFSSTTITARRIPSAYSKIREASNMLHSSLEDAWSCSNASHEAHQAKLLLNAEADYERVRLDMAISCRQKGPKISSPKIAVLPQLERLVLAHKLASTILQYYLTPWLSEDWKLRDISFFGNVNEPSPDDLVQDLQTLHLTTQFPQKNPDPSDPQPVQSTNSAQHLDSIVTKPTYRYNYGIRNMTLAKLGLALLEIGHKKDISSFKQLGPQQHDVISARILADGSYTDLGPRYHRIARKCIDCNFSAEDDLDAEGLRNAVYTNVVCELEQMIGAHRKLLESIR